MAEQVLPKGWAVSTVGALADYVNGRAFKPTEWKETGKPIIRIQNLNNDGAKYNFSPEEHEEKYRVKNGDLLFAWSASLGAHIWHGGAAWLNQHIFNVLPKECSTKQFVYYLLTKITAELYAKAHGSGMVHVTKGKFESTEILLPPLNEQHRIVAKIEELFSELDKGIENLKTAREQLKVYRQALLKHAFEGKLTVQWREQNRDQLETAAALLVRIQTEREQRYQQQLQQWKTTGGSLAQRAGKPKAPKPLPPLTAEELAELPELPVGWGWAKLGDAVGTDVGFAFKSSEFSADGMRLLRGENIEPRRLRWLDTKYWPSDRVEEFGNLLVTPGEIIIAMDRPVISSGLKVARVKQSDVPCLLVQRVARIREQHGICTEYVFSAIDQNRFVNHCLGNQTGTQLPHISEAQIRSYPVPLCSYEEQVAIREELDARLSEADQLDQTLATSLQQAEALRQSILKRAFSGQLVAQDGRDEPATALLARIRAEREAQSAKPRKTGKGDA